MYYASEEGVAADIDLDEVLQENSPSADMALARFDDDMENMSGGTIFEVTITVKPIRKFSPLQRTHEEI
jgi:hypothetical protein